ncbi:MAG: prepilin-type N-terminal cleavage/methylation domain-containing protein [Patescibacteria group bacterium]|nr:prepilin-type N-terminal cleavage/methylation domain-containing protein [Patescibacteria group bacterium]MDD5490659.1 prepilin-type N-terminal cleavage/methylation domain-containing protein [Patescibacteria group bacterium]
MEFFKKQLKSRRNLSAAGFTLMEMLVTLAIFSTALVIISNIFVLAGRAQNKSAEIEKVQSDARLAMEMMTREIRAGKIDYGHYLNGVIGDETGELALRDSEGRAIVFYAGVCFNDTQKNCLKVSIDGQAADVTSRGSKLLDLKFYIRPQSDPFKSLPTEEADCFSGNYDAQNNVCLCEEAADCFPDEECLATSAGGVHICANANTQPWVTIKFVSQSAGAIYGEQPLVALETTVSTKNYER